MQEKYRYILKLTNNSSQKYGNCEICNKPVTEVFHQTEERSFVYNNEEHWTQYKCNNLFGHKECLMEIRR
jgi:hypothetical protein